MCESSNRMKKFLPFALLTLALALAGCAWTDRHLPWHHDNSAPKTVGSPQPVNNPYPAPVSANPHPAQTPTIVAPDASLVAKVLTVNNVGRFVVLNFPVGRMPRLDQHLFLYRAGLKTAEVKVVGPQQDTSIVADIISGDAQAGDTVRDQ
jgi:hypothetical protein